MNAPQITLIVIFALGTGITITRHGKPKKGKESLWLSLVSTSILAAILYWGGFWT